VVFIFVTHNQEEFLHTQKKYQTDEYPRANFSRLSIFKLIWLIISKIFYRLNQIK